MSLIRLSKNNPLSVYEYFVQQIVLNLKEGHRNGALYVHTAQ